uniref:ABC transporter permease n=1 Tax=Thermosporothrix sp. COM3 TaxID=2490863 RepID=A0A455SU11_9CHLR|nr:hypothetical protein KTC_53300 [Thermosporothrix sp. COM3]
MTAQPPARTNPPALIRRDTVVMGRADYLSTVLRLIGVELYKFRRRPMSKVLLLIGILSMIISFAFKGGPAIFLAHTPTRNLLPPDCSSVETTIDCLNHEPTREELNLAEAERQHRLQEYASLLSLPGSIEGVTQTIQLVELILFIILAGTIVGGEYSVGTVRLMLTRGPTRTQFFLAKVGAILIYAIVGVGILFVVGILSSVVLSMLANIPQSLAFLSGPWLFNCFLYILATILYTFTYCMLALCLGTLGRATTAGVAGALVWWVVESAIQSIILNLPNFHGIIGAVLEVLPGYFMANNLAALIQNRSSYLFGNQPSPFPDLHALLVVAFYLALFLLPAWWAIRRRDITN